MRRVWLVINPFRKLVERCYGLLPELRPGIQTHQQKSRDF